MKKSTKEEILSKLNDLNYYCAELLFSGEMDYNDLQFFQRDIEALKKYIEKLEQKD
jgi:hypothetical protein